MLIFTTPTPAASAAAADDNNDDDDCSNHLPGNLSKATSTQGWIWQPWSQSESVVCLDLQCELFLSEKRVLLLTCHAVFTRLFEDHKLLL